MNHQQLILPSRQKEKAAEERTTKINDSNNHNNNNNTNNKKQICLFGLSADPPTGISGHVGIVQAVLDMQLYDEIHILPVYQHTFSEKRKRLVSYEHRFNMCKIAFEHLKVTTTNLGGNDDNQNTNKTINDNINSINDNKNNNNSSIGKRTIVVVSDAEQKVWVNAVKGISDEVARSNVSFGTAALLDYLYCTTVDVEYTFCLGADAFLDLTAGKWKESSRVIQLLKGKFLVLYRQQSNLQVTKTTATNQQQQESCSSDNNKEEIDTCYLLIQNRINNICPEAILLQFDQLNDISSSQVRQCADLRKLSTMVSPAVIQYMQQNHLYQFCIPNEEESD